MINFLLKTAWTMTPPQPYSLFHIGFVAIGFLIAVPAAYMAGKSSSKTTDRVLFGCGLILAASEAYKQLFLYYVVNNGTYDWWYFPFQLCSIPMYFCLLLPFIRPIKMRTAFYTFLQDFGLLGGIMALAEPSGLMHGYWFLTLHGLSWHILLIFLGLVVGFSHKADARPAGYVRTLPLFAICCVIATLINITTKPAGQADMFYISPYYPNNQIVFHALALKLGIPAGNLVYLGAVLLGGFLFHLIFSHIFVRTEERSHKS